MYLLLDDVALARNAISKVPRRVQPIIEGDFSLLGCSRISVTCAPLGDVLHVPAGHRGFVAGKQKQRQNTPVRFSIDLN